MTGIQQSVSSALRTHIGFFGRMNAGKSSLINAFTSQHVSIVSDTAGTTADTVKKPMEIHGIGPCVLLDTAGFDDEGDVGALRARASYASIDGCDLAVLVMKDPDDTTAEQQWLKEIRNRTIPVCGVLTHCETMDEETVQETVSDMEQKLGIAVLPVSCMTGYGMDAFREHLISMAKGIAKPRKVLDGLVRAGDVVMLVMPQDPQAPEGRLIQPEVQTIRDALDHDCITICVTPDRIIDTLAKLKETPDLVITDSQVFRQVYDTIPHGTRLTGFSVLMAAMKGDIRYLAESAKVIETLNENSRVLIAEACSHAPMEEDIGRIKIPRMLRKKAGEGLRVDITAGKDFTDHPEQYDLIIQCGGCMFNRRYMMSRIDQAKRLGVPMSNYGIVIAYLQGILDHVIIPE
ncbi:MAG: [FeFe] hydrogenase H-cluster maturation GTPase HydF [Bulleidia sp.]